MGIFGVGVLLVVQYVCIACDVIIVRCGLAVHIVVVVPSPGSTGGECEYVSFEFANSAANRMKKNSQ